VLDLIIGDGKQVRQAGEGIAAAALEAEDFRIEPVLVRYREAEGVDAANTRRLWRELVRYLVMVARLPGREYGMHGPADELWHHFVLHTQLYQSFCETHAGRFIHHPPGSTARGTAWRSRYLQFLIDYKQVFGEAPPDDIWPLPLLRWTKLPSSTADLKPRHVKAVARIEAGKGLRRGASVGAGYNVGSGCGAGGDIGGGGDGGGDGCGGGGCSGG
jgi:hypothetical protein